MSISIKQAARIREERERLQDKIRDKFGAAVIFEAEQRLCSRCSAVNCFLLPISFEGEDCPYFKPKEDEE